ncbi:TlpA disulfide reductase family protein [Mucilaginibacter sabulilitoris]|uniref:TlpA disulfide reductase family protein n=1 Tax=Mucilaginibacter sabulilitoris TaxID=1173583 RepID=A0ABZ0TIS2_9SPHI|nr:TlpA disulfide reductase family protein [Mucilaginibacter sabulilitoris]WPU92847.1 TlpA disulfide reductase family protein [Mucilaginibacter sabulilitoris]
MEPAQILKNTMSLLYYNQDFLMLSEDFIGYDTNGHRLNKRTFLKLFATGNYLPVRLQSPKLALYKLYKVKGPVLNNVKGTLKGWGELDYQHFQMEGRRLPDFNFTDLNGKDYNQQTCLGKTLVLKCWFLSCQACREEIPDLNRLVQQYRNRKDILFVSLVFDQKKDVNKFFEKTRFDYATVPDKKNYLTKKLDINLYPTHLIVNKSGIITKVVNTADELIVALNKEVLK